VNDRAEPQPAAELPEAVVETGRRFPVIWLIPLVALAAAIWLAVVTIRAQGPAVSVRFENAEGLEAGTTKVKYKNVDVGVVENVRLLPDLSGVVMRAAMSRDAAPHLRQGTRFWIVRPRLSAGGVSGLGTLVSGAYVEMDPGTGSPQRDFVGLETPPVVRANVAGSEYVLTAERLGSLTPGSPVSYRGLVAGEVLGYELAGDQRSVDIYVFVREPYNRLVRDDTRFWNASGVDLAIGAGGVNVAIDSLQAILTGGIAFDTPLVAMERPPVAAGTAFPLFKSQASISEAMYTEKVPYLMYFDGSVRGLAAGAPVEFRGLKVGAVEDVSLVFDPDTVTVRVPVIAQLEPQRIAVSGEAEATAPYDVMEKLVARGLRAQLKPGNLITGQLVVALDFYPESPPADLKRGGRYPELPTVPSDLETITRSLTDLFAKIGELPLEPLVADARSAVQAMEKLMTSTDFQRSATSLRQAADAAKAALVQMEATLGAFEGMVGQDSALRYDLAGTLADMRDAARSLRVFTDYLDRHPEALLRGKAGAEP
jgi:paraquat-inducible protein B